MQLCMLRTDVRVIYHSKKLGAKANVKMSTREYTRVEDVKTCEGLAELDHPGGFPSVMEGCGAAVVMVCKAPEESVMTSVAPLGTPFISGSIVMLGRLPPMSGVYAAAANPVVTICPAEAVTDALKAYGGVVNVGVAMAKFGSVVAMVADWDERKAAI